jgi:hypothetical protein
LETAIQFLQEEKHGDDHADKQAASIDKGRME